MKAMRLAVGLFVVAMMGQGVGAATQSVAQHEDSVQASYVRICKDRRGMRDRRACGGKDDPHRTVLAFADGLR